MLLSPGTGTLPTSGRSAGWTTRSGTRASYRGSRAGARRRRRSHDSLPHGWHIEPDDHPFEALGLWRLGLDDERIGGEVRDEPGARAGEREDRLADVARIGVLQRN